MIYQTYWKKKTTDSEKLILFRKEIKYIKKKSLKKSSSQNNFEWSTVFFPHVLFFIINLNKPIVGCPSKWPNGLIAKVD